MRLLRLIGLTLLIVGVCYWLYALVNQTPEEYEETRRSVEEEQNETQRQI